jgi:hypothetical protein
MKMEQLNENTKAVIIEIADVFYAMDLEEIPEGYPEEKEFEAHEKVISDVLREAKAEGYTKYVMLTKGEAETKGADLGINGVYLIILRKGEPHAH